MPDKDTGHGRKLRRARNVVKRFERAARGKTRGELTELENKAWDEGVLRKRYDRAVALLLAQALIK